MKKLLEKRKVLLSIFIILLIAIIAGSIFLVFKSTNQKNAINELNTDNYLLQYDSTWEVAQKENLKAELIHKKSGSELNIEINELQDEDQYKAIDEIFDSVLYNIQEQNSDYNLIYKEKTKVTKQGMDGYNMLFESDTGQASIYLYKQGSKVVLITFEASNDSFDILLDSVNNIIYNFSLKDMQFDVKTNIKLETSDMTYTEEPDISNQLKDTTEQKIANQNYLVEYSLPDNFKVSSFNTQYGYYDFEGVPDNTKLEVNTTVLKMNLYNYLEKDETGSVYSKSYDFITEADGEVTENLSKNDDCYIYKNSYHANDKDFENVVLIFELNNSHIFTVKICAQNLSIPKELVDMIKINSFKNIAGNVVVEKQDGFLLGTLKRYADYSREQVEEITLKLPETFHEVDKNTNLYEERNYQSENRENMPIPKYEITYEISSLETEAYLKSSTSVYMNNKLGAYKEFTQINDATLNDKNFKVYTGGYTVMSNSLDDDGNRYKYYSDKKVLSYNLHDNYNLIITISANIDDVGDGSEITDELMSKLTNFDINIK